MNYQQFVQWLTQRLNIDPKQLEIKEQYKPLSKDKFKEKVKMSC